MPTGMPPARFYARYRAGWHAGYAAAGVYADDGGDVANAEAAFDAGLASAPVAPTANGWYEAGWDAGWEAHGRGVKDPS